MSVGICQIAFIHGTKLTIHSHKIFSFSFHIKIEIATVLITKTTVYNGFFLILVAEA